MPGLTEVNFKTYCRVFNTIGNQSAVKDICNEIFGEGDGAWSTAQATQALYQHKVGDGVGLFPRSGDVPNGIERWYNFKYWNYLNDDSVNVMARATFLAGAFGMQEIPLKPVNYSAAALGVFCEDMPIELAERLNTFNRECVANGLDVCMTSNSAKVVAQLWAPVAACMQPPKGEEKEDVAEKRELSCRLDQLKKNYTFTESKVTDRKDKLELHRSIVPYLDKLPNNPKTVEDYTIAINKYRGMVQLALRMFHGDWAKSAEGGVPTRSKTVWINYFED